MDAVTTSSDQGIIEVNCEWYGIESGRGGHVARRLAMALRKLTDAGLSRGLPLTNRRHDLRSTLSSPRHRLPRPQGGDPIVWRQLNVGADDN